MQADPRPRRPSPAPSTVPLACARCGYPAPEGARCPTCGWPDRADRTGREDAPHDRWSALGPAVAALPRGLALLAGTPGTKRLLLPPFLLTLAAAIALLVWSVRLVRDLAERVRPDEVTLPTWPWVERLPDGWRWVTAGWHGLAAALEWVAGALVAFLLAQPFQLLTVLLVGSLALWYGASVVYEALAGPFLDEIQARVEARWYGEDPRARLERPRGLASDVALRRTSVGAAVGAALVLGLHLGLGVGLLGSLAAAPLGLLVPLAGGGGYATWLAWFLRVQARALLAGLQGALLSLGILLLALPLYLVPGVGYFLYAAATGVATATSLLDIPLERRGWPLRSRLRLLARHLPAWTTFGVLAGLLLAVPLIGPLLFVPATSLGGLWLLVRVDKAGLPAGRPDADLAARDGAP